MHYRNSSVLQPPGPSQSSDEQLCPARFGPVRLTPHQCLEYRGWYGGWILARLRHLHTKLGVIIPRKDIRFPIVPPRDVLRPQGNIVVRQEEEEASHQMHRPLNLAPFPSSVPPL